MNIFEAGLTPDKDNANEGTQRGLGLLDKSLRQLGAGRSILADKNGNIIAGNKTLDRAADIDMPVQIVESDGTQLIVVKRTDLDLYSDIDKRARQLAYADNKVAELDLSWKPEQIAIDFEPLELGEWGFDAEPETKDAEPQIDRAEILNEKWKVVTGDLFAIGSHRLLCGDSTKREDVDRVMDGEKADMVFTDPPYGMNLDVSNSDNVGSKDGWTSKAKNYEKVIGDGDDFSPLLITSVLDNFGYVKEMFLWGADYYSELIPNHKDGSWIVWDKRASVEEMKLTFSEFELCWSKNKHLREIARITWSGLLGTEQEFDHKRTHPTQKPTLLSTWFIERYSKENELIVDVYAGSGFTLTACENLHRKCRAIEISPAYCAVILQRMNSAFPDLKIERLSNTE